MPAPGPDAEEFPNPASIQSGSQAFLEPLDRFNLANTSRRTGRKVIETARSYRSVDYHVKFIPESEIRQLVNSDTVLLELKRSRKSPLTTQEPWNFCKILTILYLMSRPTKLRLFVSKGVNDTHLPFSGVKQSDDTLALISTKHPHASLVVFEDRTDAEDFLRHQWAALAHVFHAQEDQLIPHYTIDDKVILPFHGQRVPRMLVPSSRISRTLIHPDHHEWDWNKERDGIENPDCNAFAIKTLKIEDRLDYNHEAEIWRMLNKERHHPQLVTLLASYEQNGLFNLIFPWAEMDLFGYWEKHAHPVEDSRTARWIAEQCRGLAEALSRIHGWQTSSESSVVYEEEQQYPHRTKNFEKPPASDEDTMGSMTANYFGIHGDLKPENILWYPGSLPGDLGILKITKFSTARFRKDYSSPEAIPSSYTYRSPDFEVHGTSSPACDVWSLSCIFLEFITWFWGGQKKLQECSIGRLEHDEKIGINSDRFFAIYYAPEEPAVKQARVKDSVAKLIRELLAHPISTNLNLGELLVIIRDNMLVVHPRHHQDPRSESEIDSMTQSNSQLFTSKLLQRKSSEQVANYLRRMGIFAFDVVELSRQYTRDSNASSARPSTMTSNTGTIRESTSSLYSYTDVG